MHWAGGWTATTALNPRVPTIIPDHAGPTQTGDQPDMFRLICASRQRRRADLTHPPSGATHA